MIVTNDVVVIIERGKLLFSGLCKGYPAELMTSKPELKIRKQYALYGYYQVSP